MATYTIFALTPFICSVYTDNTTPSIPNARTNTASTNDVDPNGYVGDYLISSGKSAEASVREFVSEFTTGPTVIGGGETITSCVLSISTTTGGIGVGHNAGVFDIYAYDWGASLTAANFRTPTQLSAMTILTSADTTSWVDGANSFPTSSGIVSAINTSGNTRLMIAGRNQRMNNATPQNMLGLRTPGSTPSASQPKLIITTTAVTSGSPTIGMMGVG